MPNSRSLKVLIVEDEALLGMGLEQLLTTLGHEVVAIAFRLEQGLAMAEADGLDLAILDVNLAGQLSFPIAHELKAQEIPFIFATAYSDVIDETFSAVPVVRKPIETMTLLDAIRRALNA